MTNIKIVSLAISLAAFATAANAQAIIHYSDGQGYGYRADPLYPYAKPQHAAPRAAKPQAETRAPAKPSRVDPALIADLRNKRKPIAKPDTRANASVEVVRDEQKASPKRQAKASADVMASIDKAPGDKQFSKTTVVRGKPIVRKTYRVVEHPPIVVQREISEDQAGGGGDHGRGVLQRVRQPLAETAPVALPEVAPPAPMPSHGGHPTGRTIRAEAEITILGPDRMSIRLFRRQDGSDANAKAVKSKSTAKPALRRSADAKSPSAIR